MIIYWLYHIIRILYNSYNIWIILVKIVNNQNSSCILCRRVSIIKSSSVHNTIKTIDEMQTMNSATCSKIQILLSRNIDFVNDTAAYLENRRGGTAPRGRTLLPKGRTVERAPPVLKAIFVYLFWGTPVMKKILLTFFGKSTFHENFLSTFFRAQ